MFDPSPDSYGYVFSASMPELMNVCYSEVPGSDMPPSAVPDSACATPTRTTASLLWHCGVWAELRAFDVNR